MSKKRNKSAGSVVQPLRVPADMQKQIRTLSEKARLSDADIMRLAIERGLGQVEKMFAPQTEQAA
jgi:predicted DNA-binding protein